MTDAKELWIDACEDIVAELLDANPRMTEEAAYAIAEDRAWARVQDHLADLGDRARDEAKERGL